MNHALIAALNRYQWGCYATWRYCIKNKVNFLHYLRCLKEVQK